MIQWGRLQEAEFTLGETHFSVKKLPAEARFDLLEQIRYELRKSAGLVAIDTENESASVGALLTTVLSLEPSFVRTVRDTLFREITFRNKHAVTPQPLIGVAGSAIDSAFSDLEPSDIYVVLTRALSINFMQSLRGLASTIQSAGLTTPSLNHVGQADSPDSSGRSSPAESPPTPSV